MEPVLAIALILLAAVAIRALAAAIMRRLGIEPVDESARSRGFGDVISKLEAWSRERRN